MDFLDEFGIRHQYLSEEHGLLVPDLDRTNAGILPAMLASMLNVGGELNSDFKNRLDEQFPSGYDSVLFIMADGLGASHLSELGGFLWENVMERGTVANAVFPTMTSTNLASIAYGTLPLCHGMVGYNYYHEGLDNIFNALSGHYEHEGKIERITRKIPLSSFISGKPLQAQVKGLLDVELIVPAQLPATGLLEILGQGVPKTSYVDMQEALVRTHSKLNRDDPQLLAVYLGVTDHFGHRHGPESKEYEQAIRAVETYVQQVISHPKVKDGSVAVVLTSDHGQSQIRDLKAMTKETWKSHKSSGVLLGSSDRTIHAYSEDPDRAYGVLESLSSGHGIILDNEKARKLMGVDRCGSTFAHRLGDYVLLFEDGYLHEVPAVAPAETYPAPHKGQHGSLSERELFVPVCIWGE